MKSSNADLKNAKARKRVAGLAELIVSCLVLFWNVAGPDQVNAADKAAPGYPPQPEAARELGALEARRDLSNNVLVIKTAGLPGPEWEDYRRLLQERCNVKLEPIAGCIVTEGLMSYLKGYNDVSHAALKQKYGTNFFATLEAEAKAAYRKRLTDFPAERPSAYRVKAGDTLTRIARDFGIQLSELRRANPNVDSTKLRIDQTLVIPSP